MKCPKCNEELHVEHTVATDYKKVKCYNLVKKLIKNKTKEVMCGFEGYIKEKEGVV